MSDTTLEDYINQRQDIIDTMLEYKCDNGICRISEKELAQKINRSIQTLRKKIKEINKYDNAITEIANGYKVNIENFNETKQIEIYQRIHLEFVINKGHKKNEKKLAEELGIDTSDIQRIKTLLIAYEK